MPRMLRALSLGLAFLFVLPLAGCRLATLTVLLRGFDSSQIEGVRFWRQEAGKFVLDGWLNFDEIEVIDTAEVLYYTHLDRDGQDSLQLFARLRRQNSNPDVVVLELAYPVIRPGLFRVSAFNTAGDSPMSAESVVFEQS